jgi:hypothetical protein
MLALLATGPSVSAQPVAAPVSASPPPAGDPQSQRHDADALFNEAQQKIAERDLAGALALLTQCYELTGSKNLLYNMARLQQDLKDCSSALANYRLFVRDAAESAWRADAKQQIGLLESTCVPAAPAAVAPPVEPVRSPEPKPPPPTPPAHQTHPTRKLPWSTIGWFALGAGTASSITTVYFAKKAFDAKHQTDTPAGNAQVFYERAADLTRNSTYAWTFGAVSAVALGVGTYALILGARGEAAAPAERSHLAAVVLPSVAALEYTTAF